VIVHHDGYNELREDNYKGQGDMEFLDPMIDMMGAWGQNSSSPVIISGYDDRFDQYDNHAIENSFEDLQAMLAPSTIALYSITTKYWYETTVDLLRDIQWKTMALDGLVLEQTTKDMILALVAQHKDSRGHFVDDFIEGKGQVIFRLLQKHAYALNKHIGASNPTPR
jgi:hypothetical protein